METAQNFFAALRGKIALNVGDNKNQEAQENGNFDDIIEKKLNAAPKPPVYVQPQQRQDIADPLIQPLHT